MSKPELNNDEAENKKTESLDPNRKEGGEPSPAGSASLEAIASDLSSTMPDVQDHAIEQDRINEEEKVAQYSHLKDKNGMGFDPTIHKTNKAGEPTLSTKGLLILRPGRKPGNSDPSLQKSVVGGVSPNTQPSPQAEARLQARASGTMAANLVIQLGIVAGGSEWQPRVHQESGLDEKVMLENAFADYFEATGKTDIPPGMALTVAIGAYSLPRLTMPQTQTRMQKAKKGIKQWWINRKLKKHGFKAEPAQNEPNQEDIQMEA